MSIVLIHSRADLSSFKSLLQKELPETCVQLLDEVQHPEKIEYAISWKHTHGVFKKFKNLKVIASFGAGVDHIFSDKELPSNIQVTKIVNEQLTKDMCDFVLMNCLNFIRNTNEYSIAKQKTEWKPLAYKAPKDTKVSILGLGILGKAVAQHLVKQNFQVNGWAKSKKEIEGVNCFAQNELDEMLSQTHILVCLLPLTNETKGILNSTIFKNLPSNSCLINVARGEHLNEKDLKKAIEKGYIKKAFLDVFHDEPLPKQHWFWRSKAIQITPHVASITNPEEVVGQLATNYKRFKDNLPLLHQVDLKKGY